MRATLDSREFEVLVDVISVAQAPGPQVDGVGAEAQLLAGALQGRGRGRACWGTCGWPLGLARRGPPVFTRLWQQPRLFLPTSPTPTLHCNLTTRRAAGQGGGGGALCMLLR